MRPRALILSCFLILSLFALGCDSGGSHIEDNGPDLSIIAADPDRFLSTSVSMRGLPVFWTATYLRADGGVAPGSDPTRYVAVVIVNPRKVTQGLLVCTRPDMPLEAFASQQAVTIRIEGLMKSFEKKDVIAFMKQKHGVDVLTSKSGHPLWIDDQLPMRGGKPSPIGSPLVERSGQPAP